MIFFANKETAKERYDICLKCEHLVDLTKQCSQCWCWLPAKVRKYGTKCPVGKWGSATGDKLQEVPHTDEVPPLGDYKYKDEKH